MNVRVSQPLVPIDEFARLPEHSAAQSSFDIAGLLRILRERRSIILGTTGAMLGLAVLAVLLIAPTYSAKAVMMLDQRKNAVAEVNTVLSGLPTDSDSVVQNQVQVLTSQQLAGRIVDKLRLDTDPEFNTELAPGLWSLFEVTSGGDGASYAQLRPSLAKGREAAINKLVKRLSVEQVGDSTTMTISVASVDAAKSARITNAYAEGYVEDQLNAKFEATKKAASWLSNRVREMAVQVQSDQMALQAYKAEHGIVDTVGGGSLVDQQTASVSVQLINAKADLAQKTALYNRTIELQRAGRAVEAAQVVASPLIAQLRAQEVELQRQEAQLSARYLPKHPKLVDIRSQMSDTKVKIAGEVARVIDSLANDVVVGRANVQSLQNSLDQLRSKSQIENSASVKLKALESAAMSSRSIYEGLLSRLKEVQGQEGIAAPDARIISRAMEPAAASPRPATVIGIAVPASLILGLLFAFLAEAIDPSLRTTEHVDKYVGLPVLTTIPEISAQSGRHCVAESVVSDPSSSFSEAIRGLYLGLSLSNADGAPKVLLVTSSVPGEGKTVVAVSLARLAARNGRRVIIVDADFRRPAVARTMGVESSAGGIVDVLDGRLPLEQCVVQDVKSHSLVLPGSGGSVDPSDLLTSDALERLIAALRSKYDLIIIDSAPLLPVNDTLALAPLSDTALFVTHSGKTPRDAVVAALRSLKSKKVSVSGIALTRTKIDPRYGYHDYLYGAQKRDASSSQQSPKQLKAGHGGAFGKIRSLVFRPEEASAG
jgi:capsular exopolysaccharide synthesis family protein